LVCPIFSLKLSIHSVPLKLCCPFKALEATEWSADFFSRLGFKWHPHDEDEVGNHFLHGSHMVHPDDRRVFRHILHAGEVQLAKEVEDEIKAEQVGVWAGQSSNLRHSKAGSALPATIGRGQAGRSR